MKNYINDPNLDKTIEEIIDFNQGDSLPVASVVIVTYNSKSNLLKSCLDTLKKQIINSFEILIVDNSDKTEIKPVISQYDLKYIKLKKNYGLSLGRNVGIKYSRGEIVIFLDDDAIPARNFVEKHIAAYKKYNIFGLRGKALPRTATIYNYLAKYYDLGDQTIPFRINLEGNSSFKREILIKVGGFNPQLQKSGGYEGTELTYRVVRRYNEQKKLVYYPDAVIYHDYSNTLFKYLKKQIRHKKYGRMLHNQIPDLFEFIREYDSIPRKTKKDNIDLTIKLRLAIIKYILLFISLVPRR